MNVTPSRRAAIVAAASLLVACGASAPRVCRSNASCADGESCVVGKCAGPLATSPVPGVARRVLVEPESIVFISSDDGPVRDAALPIGASIGAKGRILVRFPKGDWSRDSVVKAYLILDRATGAQAGPDDVTLEVGSITEPWSAAGGTGTSWASPPHASSIDSAAAIVPARGKAPIRIDVTPYAIDLATKAKKAWGLRVEGTGGGYGVPIATGFGGGLPPRLEVYLQ